MVRGIIHHVPGITGWINAPGTAIARRPSGTPSGPIAILQDMVDHIVENITNRTGGSNTARTRHIRHKRERTTRTA